MAATFSARSSNLKNIENYMKPRGKTKVEKKTKAVKNKSKQAKSSTKLVENIESNTKQLVVLEEYDGYDTEEEEYLAICNEYKENEENDIMISESGNHLILPAVSQVWLNNCTPREDDDKHINVHFDAKEETENVVENNEEDNVSSEATETDHEAEQNVYENLIHEESATEAVNLQMVIVKDKTTVVDKNEDCECDTEEKRTCLLSGALVEYEECFNRVHILVSKAVEKYPNSNMLEQKENEWNFLLKKTYDCCATFMKHINSKGGRKMEDGGGKNTMKNPEVVELVVIIKNLEYQIKSLKDEVEASKLRETTLVKKNTNIKSEEKCDEIQTSEKVSSQISHDVSHDDEPVYYETPQTISSIINKDAKLDSKQCNEEKVEGKILGKMSFDLPSFKFISQLTLEGYKEAEPMQNETQEDSGEVDINKLIKENYILDAESKKTPVGSRISVSNVQSLLTIIEVSLTEKITGLEGNIANYLLSAYASEWDILLKMSGVSEVPRVVFESLRHGHFIHINIIHVWAHILNHDERYR
ncbi:hypothetical protein L1987_52658 [Smallanthus sonchifolius]|uniref:Uncharacterized protein n=1 Tax=Smallanthus sonchifolius TaxID=185202 RepID=A0ACB9ET40_9ASTR|nr:hypothetical protein L1987_52658 [Smallanthus sonchifolius]